MTRCDLWKAKLKPSFPGEWGHTSENWDRHEGELGHATMSLFTIPMFGESISTIILKSQGRDIRQQFHFRMFLKAQNDSDNSM